MLDPQLGVWHNIDPLSENSQTVSPYVYAADNPIKYIDPSGMSVTQTDSSTIFTGADAVNFAKAQQQNKSNQQTDDEGEGGDDDGKKPKKQSNNATKPVSAFSESQMSPINDIGTKIFGTAGLIYGIGDQIVANNFIELVQKIAIRTGFSISNVGRALGGVSKYFKAGGKISFWFASGVSLFDGINNLLKKDYVASSKDGLDVIMGGVGFAGPIGFAISGLYFLVDQTIGWPAAMQSLMEGARIKNDMVKKHLADWNDFNPN